jgi:hypothetical protein
MPETAPLGRFQDDFLRALGEAAPDIGRWLKSGASGAGLSVYRNTVAKGAIDALVANFPSVARLTGETWLMAIGAEFTRAHPPTDPTLMIYGDLFPDWLATFPPARDMPYLADIARLDRLWTESHLAADAEPLAANALASLSVDALSTAAAVLHPSARFAWFDSNIPTLWRAQRSAEDAGPLTWDARPEGLLLVRPHGAVLDLVTGPGAHAFLGACGAGQSLAIAAADALGAEPTLNLPGLIAELLDIGALAGLTELSP